MRDRDLIDRALGILHRMRLEQTGWKRIFWRWYYSDEPLRNDASNLLREVEYEAKRPIDSKDINADT